MLLSNNIFLGTTIGGILRVYYFLPKFSWENPEPLHVIPVRLMQNAQNVDLHVHTEVMVPFGSVVVLVTPGITCHVWICVVLNFRQGLHAQTAKRRNSW